MNDVVVYCSIKCLTCLFDHAIAAIINNKNDCSVCAVQCCAVVIFAFFCILSISIDIFGFYEHWTLRKIDWNNGLCCWVARYLNWNYAMAKMTDYIIYLLNSQMDISLSFEDSKNDDEWSSVVRPNRKWMIVWWNSLQTFESKNSIWFLKSFSLAVPIRKSEINQSLVVAVVFMPQNLDFKRAWRFSCATDYTSPWNDINIWINYMLLLLLRIHCAAFRAQSHLKLRFFI